MTEATSALSYLPEMTEEEFFKAELISHLKALDLNDISRVQTFIMEDIRRILNLNLISKQIDETTSTINNSGRLKDMDNQCMHLSTVKIAT